MIDSVPPLLREAARRYKDRPFLCDGKVCLSFGDAEGDVRKAAGWLERAGVSRGVVAVILLPKGIDQAKALLAVWQVGGIAVLVDPFQPRRYINYFIQNSGASIIITDRRTQKLKAVPESARRRVTILLMPSRFSGRPIDGFVLGVDPAIILYTSGSTGMPKGVVHTQQNLADFGRVVVQYLGIRKSDRIMAALPLNFGYGLNQLMCALVSGGSLILHNFLSGADIEPVLRKYRITVLAGITPMWTAMIENGGKQNRCLRLITSAGGRTPAETVRRLRRLFPVAEHVIMYGTTETLRTAYLEPKEWEKHPDSMGRAIPGVEVMIVKEDGSLCAAGEPGELVHRGALAAAGYWKDIEKTEAVFRSDPRQSAENKHLEKVVYTGDIVWQDKDGYLYHVSRKDEVIKRGGYRIGPGEIEDAVYKISGVEQCMALERRQEGKAEIVVLVVASNQEITKEKVVEYCRRELPRHMVPEETIFCSEFPCTANGKINRAELKKRYGGGK